MPSKEEEKKIGSRILFVHINVPPESSFKSAIFSVGTALFSSEAMVIVSFFYYFI